MSFLITAFNQFAQNVYGVMLSTVDGIVKGGAEIINGLSGQRVTVTGDQRVTAAGDMRITS